jgi:hypothetical protein
MSIKVKQGQLQKLNKDIKVKKKKLKDFKSNIQKNISDKLEECFKK